MKKLVAVLTALAVLVPGALANADNFNADLFVQYTNLDAKGSGDPAQTLNLIASREMNDGLSVWGSTTLTTLTTGGDTTDPTGFGTGVSLDAEYTDSRSCIRPWLEICINTNPLMCCDDHIWETYEGHGDTYIYWADNLAIDLFVVARKEPSFANDIFRNESERDTTIMEG